MICLSSFKWFECLLVEGFLSPISITDPSLFDMCIWVILNPAGVPIVLIIILCRDILYATARSVHHMGELLQPASWQRL